MNCPSVENLLALTEGSLRGPERDTIARHLESCPRCQAIAQSEERMARAAAAAAAAAAAGALGGAAEGTLQPGLGRSFGTHPDEIDLARFVEGALDETRREALLGHVAACVECRAAVSDYARNLRDLAIESVPREFLRKGLAVGTAKAPKASKAPREASLASRIARFLFPSSEGMTAWLRPAAALACILIAVALVPRLLRNPEGGPDEGDIRDGPDGGRPVATLPEGGTLSRADLAAGRVPFAWTALPGKVTYRAVIAGDDGTVLLDAQTVETRWTPQIGADRIANLDRILFWVEASSGGRQAISATRTYALR